MLYLLTNTLSTNMFIFYRPLLHSLYCSTLTWTIPAAALVNTNFTTAARDNGTTVPAWLKTTDAVPKWIVT